MAVQLDRATDEWYESEASTRLGMISELQRIRRRTQVRPIPVLLLAAAVTAALTYKLATRHPLVEAEVVLALSEHSLSAKHNGIPVDELRQFVTGVLIPDTKLGELIERRDLYRLRNKLGIQYAIDELRAQLDVQIWKNTFMYYDEGAEEAEHSARIGITVADTDPDRAYDLARDIATIVIQSTQEQRQQMTKQLAADIAATREGLSQRLDELERARSEREAALAEARRLHRDSAVQALGLELAEIGQEQKNAAKSMTDIAQSRDALADRIAAAGLDMSIEVVEEHRPDRPEHKGFVVAMIAVVIGVGSLLGSALLLGAFDSRIHDVDDVERLGLPVLGHVPGFPGDQVGSLRARGAARTRGPAFRRWR